MLGCKMFVKLKILVTSAAGFIGSPSIRHVIDNTSYSLVNVVDKLTYEGNVESLSSVYDDSRSLSDLTPTFR